MIKINLVSEGRARVKKPRAGVMPEGRGGLAGEPANLLLLVLIVLGLLVVGGRYWMLQRTIKKSARRSSSTRSA
jgi:hypothetical protein